MWPFDVFSNMIADAARFVLIIIIGLITMVAVGTLPAKQKVGAMVLGIFVILFVFFYNDIMAFLPF